MIVGETQQISVVASIRGSAPSTDLFELPTTIAEVRLRCEFEVQLRGVAFDVDPKDFQPGSFLDQSSVEWSWDVTPKTRGREVLTLAMRAVAQLGDRSIKAASSRIVHANITVEAEPRSAFERGDEISRGVFDHPLVKLIGAGGFVAIGTAIGGWARKARGKTPRKRRHRRRLKSSG
jgi:hypothetical protein